MDDETEITAKQPKNTSNTDTRYQPSPAPVPAGGTPQKPQGPGANYDPRYPHPSSY
jgi:hypothetical protein